MVWGFDLKIRDSTAQAVGLGCRITGLWPENDSSAGEDHPRNPV